MGESELKIALQREGEEQVRAFWQAAEEQVAERRCELKAEQEQRHLEADQQLHTAISRRRNSLLAEARMQAMARRLHAEVVLDERLQKLAAQSLPALAEKNRESLWQRLCAELPTAEWGKVTVTRADQEMAEREFPTAELVFDDTLVGGLIATSRDGGVRVDNSLACRLHRAWPDLLPEMMAHLRKLVASDETA